MTDWQTVVAAYAALVSTGVLFLEMRRWFESGVQLRISIMPEGQTHGIPGDEEETYTIVDVSNAGDRSTTITHLALYQFDTFFARTLKKKPSSVSVVLNPTLPNFPQNIPHLLEPGSRWTGAIRHHSNGKNLREQIQTGNLYVAIICNHRQRYYYQRIPKILTEQDNI